MRLALRCMSAVPLTAKARRTRREKAMNKTKEVIEQTAEQVVDAMLKMHRA
jgi:hypothetical protein